MNVRRAGFTLLEMIMAIGLMTVVLTSVMFFYSNVLQTRKEGEKLAQRTQLERVLLRKMAEEIRQAERINTYERKGAEEKGLGGRLQGIELVTTVMLDPMQYAEREIRDREVPAAFDQRRVLYYLIRADDLEDEEGRPRVFGLARHEFKLRNRSVSIEGEEFEERVELIAPEIRYLAFRFFDGASGTSRWQGADERFLPQAVRITMGRDPADEEEEYFESVSDKERFEREDTEYHPDRITQIVRVELADPTGISSRAFNLPNEMGLGQGSLLRQ